MSDQQLHPQFPELPKDWVCLGWLPEKEPEVLFQEDELALDEDVFAVGARDKYWVDVGWYPSFDPEGTYRCLLVKGHNWTAPLQSLETRSTEEVRDWVMQQLDHVRRLMVL